MFSNEVISDILVLVVHIFSIALSRFGFLIVYLTKIGGKYFLPCDWTVLTLKSALCMYFIFQE